MHRRASALQPGQSVIGLGVFYALTSWAPLFGYPSTHAAVAAAQGNAANFYLAPATQYAGHWVSSIMSYLIITGSFACGWRSTTPPPATCAPGAGKGCRLINEGL